MKQRIKKIEKFCVFDQKSEKLWIASHVIFLIDQITNET